MDGPSLARAFVAARSTWLLAPMYTAFDRADALAMMEAAARVPVSTRSRGTWVPAGCPVPLAANCGAITVSIALATVSAACLVLSSSQVLVVVLIMPRPGPGRDGRVGRWRAWPRRCVRACGCDGDDHNRHRTPLEQRLDPGRLAAGLALLAPVDARARAVDQEPTH